MSCILSETRKQMKYLEKLLTRARIKPFCWLRFFLSNNFVSLIKDFDVNNSSSFKTKLTSPNKSHSQFFTSPTSSSFNFNNSSSSSSSSNQQSPLLLAPTTGAYHSHQIHTRIPSPYSTASQRSSQNNLTSSSINNHNNNYYYNNNNNNYPSNNNCINSSNHYFNQQLLNNTNLDNLISQLNNTNFTSPSARNGQHNNSHHPNHHHNHHHNSNTSSATSLKHAPAPSLASPNFSHAHEQPQLSNAASSSGSGLTRSSSSSSGINASFLAAKQNSPTANGSTPVPTRNSSKTSTTTPPLSLPNNNNNNNNASPSQLHFLNSSASTTTNLAFPNSNVNLKKTNSLKNPLRSPIVTNNLQLANAVLHLNANNSKYVWSKITF